MGTTIFSAHPKTFSRAPGDRGATLACLDRSHEGSRAETRCMATDVEYDRMVGYQSRDWRCCAEGPGRDGNPNLKRAAVGVFNLTPLPKAVRASRSSGWLGVAQVTWEPGDHANATAKGARKQQAQNQPDRGLCSWTERPLVPLAHSRFGIPGPSCRPCRAMTTGFRAQWNPAALSSRVEGV